MSDRDVYTDEEFWTHNPYPETADGDYYTIGTTPYHQDEEDGDWHKVDQDW